MTAEGAVAEKQDFTMRGASDAILVPRKSAAHASATDSKATDVQSRIKEIQTRIEQIKAAQKEIQSVRDGVPESWPASVMLDAVPTAPRMPTAVPANADEKSSSPISAIPPIAPYVLDFVSAKTPAPASAEEQRFAELDRALAQLPAEAPVQASPAKQAAEFLASPAAPQSSVTETLTSPSSVPTKATTTAPRPQTSATTPVAKKPAPAKAAELAARPANTPWWKKTETKKTPAPAAKPSVPPTSTAVPRIAPKPVDAASAAKPTASSEIPAAKTAAMSALPTPVKSPVNSSMPVPLSAIKSLPKPVKPETAGAVGDVGTLATGAWLAGSVLYLGGVVGWNNLVDLPAHQLGAIIAGVAAPLALIWMGVQYVRRHEDIKKQIAPLVKQVDQLLNPVKQVYPGIESAADSLRRQANELINAANQVEKTLAGVREGLRSDMEKMMENAGLTGKHLEQAFLAMGSRTTQLARLTEQMHGRLASFEEHAKNGSDRLDQSVTDMMHKAQGASDRLERQTNNIVAALHAANMRIQRTADDLDSRIGQIASFADQTAVRFGAVASEFGKQGAVVDAAAQNIESHMIRLNQTFSGQLADMAQAIQAFSGIGDELSAAVMDFRQTARQIVSDSAQQVHGLVRTLDSRLQDAQAMLDRSAGVVAGKLGGIDRTIEKQLVDLQASLRHSADETPKLIKSILDETTQKLLEMDMRFSGAGSQVTNELQQLESRISTSLVAMTNLAGRMSENAGANMKTAMVSVFSELENMNDEFSQRAASTTRDLSSFHNELSQTIESLAHVARRATDRTVERILTLNSSIGQRILDLRDTASQAQEQGQKLEHTLVQHVGMLREANEQISSHAGRIETRGNEMVKNLMHASGTAMAQAELLSHVIGREAENLRAAASAAAGKLDDSGAVLEMARSEVYASISSAAGQINDVVRDIERQRALMDASRNDSTETQAALYQEILRLRDLTIELNQNISGTLLATDGRAKELQQLTTRLGEVTMGVRAVMTSGQQTLEQATDMMSTAADNAQTIIQNQAQRLSSVASTVVQNSDLATASLYQQQDALSRAANEGTLAVNTLSQQLKDTAITIGRASDIAAQDLEWLCSRIEEAGKSISDISGQSTSAIERARNAIVLSEASLQRSASSARVNLAELSQRYGQEAGRVEDAGTTVARSYGSAITRLEKLAHELAEQTFNTFDSMTELSALFDNRISQMRTGGELARDQIEGTALLLQRNYESLTQLAHTTTVQLNDINNGFGKVQTDMTITSDHTRSKVDAARRELAIYAQDLMMMVSQAAGQIDAVTQGFAKRAEAMQVAAEQNASQIGSLGQTVRAEVVQIADLIQNITQQQGSALNHAVSQLRSEAQHVMQAATTSLKDFEQQGTRAMQRVATLNESVNLVGQKLDRNFETLEAKGKVIQQSTDHLGQQVVTASGVMDSHSHAIQSTAERVAKAISDAGKKLAQQINSFDESGAAMQGRVEILANNIAQQAATLQNATQQAEDTANKLSQSEIRLRRDAFMNAAKYLVESLNSLAIDLTRVLDPVEAERVWKEFNKGDSSAFTRRFLQMRDEVSAKRLRDKFENDYEFRTYVQRYFRQFEELYSQAQQNDHHDMLATTITTSDVGKLYTYLAGAFGHARLKVANAA